MTTPLAARSPDGDAAGARGVAGSTTLRHLLATCARHDPTRKVLRDSPGREFWSGRPARTWTADELRQAARRVSTRIAALGLAAGTPVGILAVSEAEIIVSMLAVEEAGLTACLLPVSAEPATLARLIEEMRMEAVITQTVVGDLRPGDTVAAVAAGYFRLRFLLAFGPDVPNGVTALDEYLDGADMPSGQGTITGRQTRSSYVAFTRRPEPTTCRVMDALQAAAEIVAAAAIAPDDRILSLVSAIGPGGFAAGFAAALVSGGSLVGMGLFDSSVLATLLEDEQPTHLVIAARVEPFVASLTLPDHVRSLIILHEPPVLFRSGEWSDRTVVDVLSIDHATLLVARRGPKGRPAFSIAANISPADGSQRISLGPDGTLLVRIGADHGSARAQGGLHEADM